MTALHSQKYLAGSRDAPCALQIPGVCINRDAVPCHARDRHTGRSIKASDLSVIDGCPACHDVFDRRAKMPNGELISETDWLFYALRGLQDTLERRREIGLLFVPEDAVTERRVKPRKPAAERAKVPAGRPMESRSTFPPSRPITGRNNLRRREN
jgi:hypothetical protein